jgi:hypothetical protein
MAQNLQTGLIINSLTGNSLNVINRDVSVNGKTIGFGDYYKISADTTYSTFFGSRFITPSNNPLLCYGTFITDNNTILALNETLLGNTSIGYGAQNNTTDGNNYNTSIGCRAIGILNSTQSPESTIIGYESMKGDLGVGGGDERITSLGFKSNFRENFGTIMSYVIAIGSESKFNSNQGSYNIAIGYKSSYNSIYGTIFLGTKTEIAPISSGTTTVIGYNSFSNKPYNPTRTIETIILGTTGTSIGIGTSTPDDSAKLQIDSTKGFLPPRMTAVQAEAISTPAEGLMVYINDQTGGSTITSKGWWGYSTSGWVKIGP